MTKIPEPRSPYFFDHHPHLRALIEYPLLVLAVVTACWLIDRTMNTDARSQCANGGGVDVCEQAGEP